jgi:hypothetical protein
MMFHPSVSFANCSSSQILCQGFVDRHRRQKKGQWPLMLSSWAPCLSTTFFLGVVVPFDATTSLLAFS